MAKKKAKSSNILILLLIVGVLALFFWLYQTSQSQLTDEALRLGGTKSDDYCLDGGICDDAQWKKTKNMVSQILNNKYTDSDFSTYLIKDDFAKGAAALKTGGQYAWIAIRNELDWTIIETFSGDPTCKTMERYSVPTDLYTICI